MDKRCTFSFDMACQIRDMEVYKLADQLSQVFLETNEDGSGQQGEKAMELPLVSMGRFIACLPGQLAHGSPEPGLLQARLLYVSTRAT